MAKVELLGRRNRRGIALGLDEVAWDIVVVGGGAAGYFAAIAAAERGRKVTLLEAGSAVLAKVRISGGGRCNVTHACFEPRQLVQSYPRGGKALLGPLSRFQPADTVHWFQSRGVPLKTEADGRMFPISDDSRSIVQCLRQTAQSLGVQVHPDTKVGAVHTERTGFRVQATHDTAFQSRSVILATGGSRHGHRIAASLGHRVVSPVPSLFTFQVDDGRIRELSGISADVDCQLCIENVAPRPYHRQSGPLLITHWGLSGPAILRLSAWSARELHSSGYRARIQIDWLRDVPHHQAQNRLKEERLRHAKQTLDGTNPFHLPRRLWRLLAMQATHGRPLRWGEASNSVLRALLEELKRGQYSIQGKYPYKEEFVTCGGVALREIDFRTMSSRIVPHLHFAGEILDIDGLTGGFNFQNAWTTGWLAGVSAGQ